MRMNPLSALSDNVTVDKDKCIACGICIDRCILDNLRLLQPPCSANCPLGINAQGYVQLTKKGEYQKAIDHIYERTPYVGILGYICNHPCENECNRIEVDNESVSIRAVKRFLAEIDETTDPRMEMRKLRSEKVAIIGGGPAGMSCAWDLVAQGLQVTIFDENDSLGGMIRKAIPTFRIPKLILDKETEYLTELPNVELRMNTVVGKDVMFSDLVSEYDAVFLAVGTHKPIEIAGLCDSTITNTYNAIDYLSSINKGLQPIQNKGDVTVIGGGDVAIDVALNAMRSGHRNVKIVSLEGEDCLPASPESVQEAKRAGITFQCGWGISSVEVRDNRVEKTLLNKCLSVFDEQGGFSPELSECEACDLPIENLVFAIGQEADYSFLSECVSINNNKVLVDPLTMQTSIEGVFCGGDIVSGANTIVNAMADGKRAAESIIRFLNGDDLRYGRMEDGTNITDFDVDLSNANEGSRVELYNEGGDSIERALTSSEANSETSRCLSCGNPVGYRRTCWMCFPCEFECPYDAMEIKVHYTMA